MKALLISTLLAGAPVNGGSVVNVDQMHIWFEGPQSHIECDRAKTVMSLSNPVVAGGATVSSKKVNTANVERTVECIKFQ